MKDWSKARRQIAQQHLKFMRIVHLHFFSEIHFFCVGEKDFFWDILELSFFFFLMLKYQDVQQIYT